MKNNNFQGNSAQMMAISHYKGPAMVLAGPGSGKTFVIVSRIRYLIEVRGVVPSSILVITFTKAAALEMQQRFMKNTDSSYPEVTFGTFHSIFYQIIKNSGHYNSKHLEIANESFKQKIIYNILFSIAEKDPLLKEEMDSDTDICKNVLSEISRIKNSSLKSDDCNSCFAFSKHFKEIFEKYKRALKEFEKIDFDDMILLCYELLSEDEALLELCRKKYRFILIDEYQDINLMQYKVIELLIGKEKNLFIVGDDDQSIYGFRGSEPRFMLEFADSFKDDDPKTYNLNINYRCGSDILNNALLVIGENKERLLKDLKANGSNGPGCLVPLKFTTKENQYNSIKTFLLRQKDNLSNISIICRTNSECMSIAAMLKEEKIPTNLDECSKSFLEAESVMVLINYLKFSCVERRREFFYKFMNKPLRYISREAVPTEIVNEMAVKRFYKSNKRMLEEVNKLFSQINMISHMRPSLSVRYIRKEIGIDRAFPKEKEQLDEFEKLARTFEDTKSLLNEMDKKMVEKADDKGVKKRNNGNFVKLLTMHGSKGLEFDMVWIPDLNEGIIPSRGAATDSQIEEERRMLYVAMTRAKQALMISFVTGTKENAMLPSRFLRPIRSKWTLKYGDQPSSPSSGSSTSSSNSTSSR